MKTVLHLMTTDVRHWWPLLAAWIAIVILCAIAPCAGPWLAGGDVRLLSRLEIPAMLLTIAYPLVLLLAIAQVVQADPLVGARAFWMTRPIPARALLASKVLLLATVAVIIPVIVEVVRMAVHDVPWSVQLGVAIETALSHALLLSLLMAGAAVTENLSRLLMLIGMALGALTSALVAMVMLFGPRVQTSYPGWSLLPDPTTDLLQLGLMVAAASAAVAAQYLTRSRARAATCAAVGAVVAMLLPGVWPWPILQPKNDAPAWARGDTALQPRVGPMGAMRFVPTVAMDGTEWIGITAPLEIDGVEPHYTARVGIVDATIRVGQESLTSYRELFPVEPLRLGDALHPIFAIQRSVLQVDHVPTPPGLSRMPSLTLFSTDGPDLRKHAPGTGEYRGRLRIALNEHVVEAVLPLSVGAHHRGGAYGLTIHGVSERWGVVSVQAHESLAISLFSRRAEPYYGFYLRNQVARAAVHGAAQAVGEATGAMRLLPIALNIDRRSGFTAREVAMRFAVQPGMNADGIAIDETWLADAELVVVRMSPAGSVERDLYIKDVRLELPSRSASSSAR